jgi:hypothetical protein
VILEVDVSANTDTIAPEDVLAYTVIYRKIGSKPATGVYVFEYYDRVSFVAASPPPMLPNKNIWDIGTVGPGITGTIAVTVKVNPGLADGSILLNLVQLDSAETPLLSDIEMTSVSGQPLCPCPWEPNNRLSEAFGELQSGQKISAYPEDEYDIYYFLLRARRTIIVNVTNYTAVGQLLLYYENPEDGELIEKGQDSPEGQAKSWMNVALKKEDAKPGRYYIYIHTSDYHNKSQMYNLEIIKIDDTGGG